jgi:NAD(P)-dependent dehydrogenase (short-subunit alcohol dehydrogenase family)
MQRVVLITGASSGIGRATAERFLAEGWGVAATMRNPTGDDALSGHPGALVTRLDVTDEASIAAAFEATLARFGRLDAVVNNAGYGAYGPLEATSMASVRRQFDVNVVGLLAVTKAALPHLRGQGAGTIVNVSSMGGRMAFPLGTLYHGSKFAVEGLSEALHYELAPLGVRVRVIEPGAVRTDFAGRSFEFSNDPALTGYQPLVGALFTALGPMMAGAADPAGVAEAIHAAVVDRGDWLRRPVGADAEHILAARKAVDDAAFFAGIRGQFGLGA